MSKLVIMTWIDTILKHVKTINENMMKYSKIWANGRRNVLKTKLFLESLRASRAIKNGVINIQAAGYNGARMVCTSLVQKIMHSSAPAPWHNKTFATNNCQGKHLKLEIKSCLIEWVFTKCPIIAYLIWMQKAKFQS